MVSDASLLKLVERIYDAAADTDSWEGFLSTLSEVCGCRMAVLFWRDAARKQYDYTASRGLSPEYFRLYTEHFGAVDEWFRGGTGVLRTGWAGVGQMLCSDQSLVKTEFYSDFLRPFDVFHQCGGIIHRQGTVEAAISLLRPRNAGEFGDSEIRIVSTLIPHLQRAMQLRQKLTDLKTHARILEEALNQINLGVILLDGKGEVTALNQSAQSLSSEKGPLRIEHKKVELRFCGETARLRRLIATAINPSLKKAGGTMLIPRAGKHPLFVLVAPLHNSQSGIGSKASVILFVADPEEHPRIPVSLLTEGFGLTPAEARLALIIATGASLTQACDICGITHNTGRSELKSIFCKTHVQRQGELIKLLLGAAVAGREIKATPNTYPCGNTKSS